MANIDFYFTILKILRDDSHPAGKNTIKYIKERILNLYPEEKKAQESNKYHGRKDIFDSLFQQSFDVLIQKRHIEDYELNLKNSGLPVEWADENLKGIYYITDKGRAALKREEIYGRRSDYDIRTIDTMLPYMTPFGVYNLNDLAEILKELKMHVNNKGVISFLLAHGLAEDIGESSVRFTNRGRRLWRKGSVSAYFEDVRFRLKVKTENRKLENELLKNQIKTNRVNNRLFYATTIISVVALASSLGSVIISWWDYRLQEGRENKTTQIESPGWRKCFPLVSKQGSSLFDLNFPKQQTPTKNYHPE